MYKLYMCFKYLIWRWPLSLLAILPVALGVFMIIFVGSIMTGFADKMEDMTRGVLSDIICNTGLSGIQHYEEFCEEVRKDESVRLATPVVYLYGLVKIPTIQGYSRGCEIFGVKPEEKVEMGRFSDYLMRQKGSKRPSFDLPPIMAKSMRDNGLATHPGVIVGSQVITVGSGDNTTHLTSLGGRLVLAAVPIRESGALDLGVGGVPKVNAASFTIVDTFTSGFWPADSGSVHISIEEAQKLTGMDNPPRVNQFQIRLAEGADPAKAREKIQEIWLRFRRKHPDLIGRPMIVETWQSMQAQYLQAVKMQRNVTILMLSAILIAASVLILVTTWVICHTKTRDIGILKALGASDGGVATIFTTYGLTVSLIGALIGLGVAFLGISNLQTLHDWVSQSIGFDVFPSDVYYFDKIPHKEPPWLVWGTFCITVLLGTLSSAIASFGTARKPPVEALRYE